MVRLQHAVFAYFNVTFQHATSLRLCVQGYIVVLNRTHIFQKNYKIAHCIRIAQKILEWNGIQFFVSLCDGDGDGDGDYKDWTENGNIMKKPMS